MLKRTYDDRARDAPISKLRLSILGETKSSKVRIARKESCFGKYIQATI